MQRKYTCLKRFCSRSGRVDDEATYSICLKIVHGGTKNRQSVGQEEQYYRGDSQFLSGCSALLYILSALVDICWPCTVQLLRMQKIYSQSERSNLINQEWHVVVHYVQQDRMWSSLSSLLQVLYTCYGHSSWNYSSPRSKTSPLNHLTYHCLLSILVRQGLSHLHTFGIALTCTLLLPV